MENENNIIKQATDLVDKLAGSVSIPAKLKKLSMDQLVSRAKKMHFSKTKGVCNFRQKTYQGV